QLPCLPPARTERFRLRRWARRSRRVLSGGRPRPGRLAGGRWRPSCRAASLETEAAQALVEIAANRVNVLASGEPAAAPGAGARVEHQEHDSLRRLFDG